MSRMNHDAGGSEARFGTHILHFPKATRWTSPFAVECLRQQLELMPGLRVEFDAPKGWRPLPLSPPDGKFSILSPAGNATLMLSAGLLLLGAKLEMIAGSPFIKYQQAGATSPVVVTTPIVTADHLQGHQIHGPLMFPGNLVGMPNEAHVPMFKHTIVIAKDGHWFSFETQAWGAELNIPTEVAAQMELYSRLKVVS